uniref:Uncharacterized protein n=1 Tax=Cannabis sativa TaxID=3483 RepID=A0A803QNF5_CANSA
MTQYVPTVGENPQVRGSATRHLGRGDEGPEVCEKYTCDPSLEAVELPFSFWLAPTNRRRMLCSPTFGSPEGSEKVTSLLPARTRPKKLCYLRPKLSSRFFPRGSSSAPKLTRTLPGAKTMVTPESSSSSIPLGEMVLIGRGGSKKKNRFSSIKP